MAFPELDVWMNGQRVGLWFWTRTGTTGLRYDARWAQSVNARSLSLSLPMPAGGGDLIGAAVENYFDNLLPDSSRIRERLRRHFGAPSTRAADLLAAIGPQQTPQRSSPGRRRSRDLLDAHAPD